MTPAERTLHVALATVAAGLRDFGYGHVNTALIRSHYEHWKRGAPAKDDVIYKFAVGDFEKNPEIFGLPDNLVQLG